MPAKEIAYNQPAREAILRGVQLLAEAVAVTLGPKGRNVVIEKSFGSPLITKDGVTVAKAIALEDKFANMGAPMAKEVAAGVNPMDLKRGIDQAVETVVEELKKLSKPTKDHHEIQQVGTISANG